MMTTIDAKGVYYRQLNERVREIEGDVTILNCVGQRYIVDGRPGGSRVVINGTPHGPQGASLTLRSSTSLIHSSDCE